MEVLQNLDVFKDKLDLSKIQLSVDDTESAANGNNVE